MSTSECPHCRGSGRPGFVVFVKYYDRMIETDVIGERKLTSGVEWLRCMICRGAGKVNE